MADVVVSCLVKRLGEVADVVVSSLVQRLGEFPSKQVDFLQGVKDEVESLKIEWKYMLAFLKDAEEKQFQSHNIKQWVSDIIDAAYDAEALIDEFIIKFEEEEEEEEGHILKKARVTSWIEKGCKEVAKQADLYEIGKEIKKLKDRLDEIEKNRKKYEITNIGGAGEGSSTRNDRFKELRRTTPDDEDDEHVVGFKKDAEILTSQLLKEMPHRCVISIVGMGGLGKTTIARKLYNNSIVGKKFDCFAWVSVSNDYNIQNLLRRIIKSFKVPITNEELEKMEIEDLVRHLREFLKESRYLVVIDDVWDTDAWASLRRALPENKKRSRVIITTRNNAVAESTCGERKYIHTLSFLDDNESWALFCKNVVSEYDGVNDKTSSCTTSLKGDVLKKCHGLPLAIVVLGGLLSRKHTDEWPKLLQGHIWRHVSSDDSKRFGPTYVQQILALSFNDLPHHLKSCFLYLGMFPEDFEINVDKLIRLWVAEDFIQQRDGEGLEETAMEYLKELIDRNLIQVSRRNWRRINSCRVHDLLRDFAIEKSKELNFLHIYDGNGYSTLSPTRRRRLASHNGGLKRFDSSYHSSNFHLRTLLFFNLEDESAKIEELKFLYPKLRLLRVFDSSEDTEIVRLPHGIGKLIHLRYLGLHRININELPPSIGKLHALQTLEFNTAEEIMLPDEICNAKQLRHLSGWFKWPFQVKNLTNLRTLYFVEVDDRMEFDPLTDLINLHELHVIFNGESKGFTLDSIGRLRSLQTLSLLQVKSANWFPTLQPLSHCQHLLQLKLLRMTGKLPTEMHEILPNLKYLELEGIRMEEDPMPSLEKLPKLTILDLRIYDGIKLLCTAGGFPQLEILQLWGDSVEELQVGEGGMLALQGLRVRDGVRIPEKLRSILAPKNWDPSEDNDWPY